MAEAITERNQVKSRKYSNRNNDNDDKNNSNNSDSVNKFNISEIK